MHVSIFKNELFRQVFLHDGSNYAVVRLSNWLIASIYTL